MVHTRTLKLALVLAVTSVLAALPLGAGCVGSTAASKMPEGVVLPDVRGSLEKVMAGQSEWRKVNRVELAGSLGWSQVSRGNTTGRQVALTFDAGASAGPTAAVLDTLKAAGLHCTFFITGQFSQESPALVQRMAVEGHEVANHSWSHPRFTTLSPEQVASEIERTEDAVRALTQCSTKPYFRFPYGAGSGRLVEQINSLGYIGVLWTFDTLDSLGASAETVRTRVRKYACPGAIILMHCGSAEGARALPSVIADLKDAGFEPVTLTEVLRGPKSP